MNKYNMIEYLDWDSSHFGIKVGNLFLNERVVPDLTSIINQAKSEDYDLVYLKGATISEENLSDSVVLADKKMIYLKEISREETTPDSHVTSWLNHSLDVDLLSLALQSGSYSRYYTDKRMPLHIFLTLYQTWISNSLNGTIATDVLVYKHDNNIVGLLSYKIKQDRVVIGLVDVDRKMKGKGIGRKMMQTLFSLFPIGTKVEVATQKDNVEACRFYERNGFGIESVTNIYHIWINK